MATTKNLAEVIRRKLAADPDLASAVDAERFNLTLGEEIRAARVGAGLTQQQLAEKVGTQQPAIARLEDADYDSHSINTLERIAAALGKRLQVRFIDASSTCQRASEERFVIPSPSDADRSQYYRKTAEHSMATPPSQEVEYRYIVPVGEYWSLNLRSRAESEITE
jgi:transcriptional regulator with XRE-family HTH domain